MLEAETGFNANLEAILCVRGDLPLNLLGTDFFQAWVSFNSRCLKAAGSARWNWWLAPGIFWWGHCHSSLWKKWSCEFEFAQSILKNTDGCFQGSLTTLVQNLSLLAIPLVSFLNLVLDDEMISLLKNQVGLVRRPFHRLYGTSALRSPRSQRELSKFIAFSSVFFVQIPRVNS